MYDLVVIGAGWAGFNAAKRAGDLGLRTCLIEAGPIGGTCLNYGCIPTKSLIQSAKVYSLAKKSSSFGIELDNPKVNFQKVQERKDKLIQQLRLGMASMLKGIDLIKSDARLTSPNTIKVGNQTIEAKFIILATGSTPVELSCFKFDSSKIVSSNEILSLKEAPQNILIIGGGVIGCEFASLFSILGSQVTLAEKMPQLLPGEDSALAKKLESVLKKKGVKVNTGVNAATFNPVDFEKVLVCVGRKPNIDNLGLEDLGVNLENKKIVVNEFLATNIPNIYACGDCTGKIMLAHYAAYQGNIAAENIVSGNKIKADNQVVPSCIFTDPEIASAGLSEEKAIASGRNFSLHKFDFLGSGMARILDETEGFIKVLSDKESQEIIGACIIGPKATELISVFGVSISAKLKLKELREVIFAHPTLSESIHESLN